MKTQTPKSHASANSEPLRGTLLDSAFLAMRGKLVQESEEEKKGAAWGSLWHSEVCGKHSSRQLKPIPSQSF